jgi:hypothetical protein
MAAKRGPNPDAGKRVILRGYDVLTLPTTGTETDVEAIDAVLKAARTGKTVDAAVLKRALAGAHHTLAWKEVETVEVADERRSVEAVAGKPNTPDAKPGRWKSVPLTNWKGEATYERPPEPLVGASWTDD